MPRPRTLISPLREIRDETGLSAEMVAEKLGKLLGEPRTYLAVIQIERRGCATLKVIQALSQIYGLPLHDVALAADPKLYEQE